MFFLQCTEHATPISTFVEIQQNLYRGPKEQQNKATV